MDDDDDDDSTYNRALIHGRPHKMFVSNKYVNILDAYRTVKRHTNTTQQQTNSPYYNQTPSTHTNFYLYD